MKTKDLHKKVLSCMEDIAFHSSIYHQENLKPTTSIEGSGIDVTAKGKLTSETGRVYVLLESIKRHHRLPSGTHERGDYPTFASFVRMAEKVLGNVASDSRMQELLVMIDVIFLKVQELEFVSFECCGLAQKIHFYSKKNYGHVQQYTIVIVATNSCLSEKTLVHSTIQDVLVDRINPTKEENRRCIMAINGKWLNTANLFNLATVSAQKASHRDVQVRTYNKIPPKKL